MPIMIISFPIMRVCGGVCPQTTDSCPTVTTMRVRCKPARAAAGSVEYQKGEVEFPEVPQRHRARSRKFVLVEFLTAVENADIWRFAAGKAPFPALYS